MPRRCTVKGCRSNYDGEEERFSTFALPRDEELRKKWLLNIPNDISHLKTPWVCEKHFRVEEVIRVDRARSNGVWKEFPRILPKLKDGAIPSIFPNLSSEIKIIKSKKGLPEDNYGYLVRNPVSEDVPPMKIKIIDLRTNANVVPMLLNTYPRTIPETTTLGKKLECGEFAKHSLKPNNISSSSLPLNKYPRILPKTALTKKIILTEFVQQSTDLNNISSSSMPLKKYPRIMPKTTALRKKLKCGEFVKPSIDPNNISSLSSSSKVIIQDDFEICPEEESDDIEPFSLSSSSNSQYELKIFKQFESVVSFRVERITDDDTMYSATGFNVKAFHALFELLCLEDLLQECQLSPVDQFFLMTVYLKTGISQDCLAHLYKIEQSIVAMIVRNTAIIVYNKLKNFHIWPSRVAVQNTTPSSFSEKFPNCRVIIDCIEFNIQTPSNLWTEEELLNRKNTYTAKGMIGITPSGTVSFISDLVGGSMSDKDLFLSSGLLDFLQPGDLVLADKGFNIKSELDERGCKLTTPDFCKSVCSSDEEDEAIFQIEKIICQFKTYKYFNGDIENSCLEPLEEFFFIVAFFLHFSNPLVP